MYVPKQNTLIYVSEKGMLSQRIGGV